MSKVPVPACGSVGVIKDLGIPDLSIAAWTDASNIRFLDGSALQFLGHGAVYNDPTFAPQYVMPIYVAGARYWLYMTATKQFAVTNTGGVAVHTDISHLTPRAGVVNQWSGTVFGGIPVFTAGDASTIPMYWDQNLTHKFVDLTAWPAATYCKTIRAFKNLLVAANITKGTTNYPFMIKWSSLADPGSLPTTWDITDVTKEAGEFDIGDGQDPIIDTLGLKDSLVVYKESSTHALNFIGGQFILSARKVFGMSGLMNKNCAVDVDSFHFAVTGSDIVVHDSYSATSILDKKARRSFFQSIDVANRDKVFCFLNPFLNEIFVAYPSIGATSCDKALVYNFVDKTVSYRSLPHVNHAHFGPVDNSLGGNWNQDSAPWDSDLTAWNGPDYTPDTVRVIMASADTKLFMLDASASFDGSIPVAFLEKRGIDFGEPEYHKLITGIRPRIFGNVGETVIIKIGFSDDPYADPTYTSTTFTIGVDLQVDILVSARYAAIRIETGTAYQWRLDSYDWLDVIRQGQY
jgi:hypothetical protein